MMRALLRHPRATGFTLLELMVVLAVAASLLWGLVRPPDRLFTAGPAL